MRFYWIETEYILLNSRVDSTEKCPESILTEHSADARK